MRRSKAALPALATASGQAAETLTITTLAAAGEEIVSTTSLYGGTYNLFHYTLPRLGINVRFVDADDFDGMRAAINDKTRAIYTETLGNPKLDIADIETLAAIAHENRPAAGHRQHLRHRPALVRPIEWGADIVVNSATKFLGGHGTAIGGVIVDAGKFDWAASGRFKEFTEPDPSYHGLSYIEAFGPLAFILKARIQGLRDTGAALSPFNAFLLLQGIETLHLRMERHSQNALAVARHLEQHPGVEWVNYPGLESSPYYARAKKYLPNGQGALITFGIKGGYEAGQEAHRLAEAVLAAGQHRRRQVAGHSPRLDHAPAAFRRGAGRHRRDSGDGPALGGHRRHPRHPRRPRSGHRSRQRSYPRGRAGNCRPCGTMKVNERSPNSDAWDGSVPGQSADSRAHLRRRLRAR